MKLKPILFNTEMVRAILEGRKTTTRRIFKDVVSFSKKNEKFILANVITKKCDTMFSGNYEQLAEEFGKYQVGDILYVRETWCKGSLDYQDEKYYYKADNNDFLCKWHPSIHMPKEAARIFLKVTDVRVERLQDITEEGTVDEGIGYYGKWQLAFAKLWDSTVNKKDKDKYSWDANPYVWVISFKRVSRDEIGY